jgi:hypothetical protein
MTGLALITLETNAHLQALADRQHSGKHSEVALAGGAGGPSTTDLSAGASTSGVCFRVNRGVSPATGHCESPPAGRARPDPRCRTLAFPESARPDPTSGRSLPASATAQDGASGAARRRACLWANAIVSCAADPGRPGRALRRQRDRAKRGARRRKAIARPRQPDARYWAQARATNHSARPRSGRPLIGEAIVREGGCGRGCRSQCRPGGVRRMLPRDSASRRRHHEALANQTGLRSSAN